MAEVLGVFVFLFVIALTVYLFFHPLHKIDKSFRNEITAFLEEQKLILIELRDPVGKDWNNIPSSEQDPPKPYFRVSILGINRYGRFNDTFFKIIVYEYNGYRENAWVKIETEGARVVEIKMKIIKE